MAFTREQQKEAYKKLSPEVQDFVMSNETTELISNFLKESGLSEDQETIADSEILYAMLGLQSLSSAIINIAKLANKDTRDLFKLKGNLEDNIFNKIPQNTETEGVTKENQTQNNVGTSFEQIILNQAKAMQPARGAGEDGKDAADQKVPGDLPTGEQKTEEKPGTVRHYSGNDPYREPPE